MDRKVAQRMARFSQMAVAASTMALPTRGWTSQRRTASRRRGHGHGNRGFIEMTNGAISYATKGRLNPLLRADDHPQHGRCVGGDGISSARSQHHSYHGVRSSTHTIGDAMRILQTRDADVMLAGGARHRCARWDLCLQCHPRRYPPKRRPEKASRPFDRDRDGFVPGEGARHPGA